MKRHGRSQERAWLLNWLQGGLPVAISMTVQATDQMSACRPCPVCLITSGAIQYGVPLMDLHASESARARRPLLDAAIEVGDSLLVAAQDAHQ